MSNHVAVIGSFVQDLAFKVETFPATGETRIGTFFTGPGGKGSNQAVACHRQGVATTFIGAIGEDLLGAGYREWSTKEGLSTQLLVVPTLPTGAASIVVNKMAENAIVVALGANDALTPEHVLQAMRKEPALKVALLQAESNLEAAHAALSHARERGLFSILNPAPINPDVTQNLLSLADCITPNETECAYLLHKFAGTPAGTDVTTLSDADLRSVCDKFPSPTVLITVGSQGSILYQRDVPPSWLSGVEKGTFVRIPALKVNPIDTTGAGDAFNGGLAAGLIRFNGDIIRAIRYATVVAGLSTERPGTAPAMPSRREVEAHAEFYS
jgi:ribokinase